MKTYFIYFFVAVFTIQCSGKSFERIAFGSCMKESKPAPIWTAILGSRPDVFIMMGDNIYGDSTKISTLRRKYKVLFDHPVFSALREKIPVLATWDDHDYGKNDAGKELSIKEESQQLFYSFFRPKASLEQKSRPGVYDALYFGTGEKVVQILLLDTRYFRDALEKEKIGSDFGYIPSNDASRSLLGQVQWKWLERELQKPANLRILVSSIEFNGDEHKYEKWHNFPQERHRLFDLIRQTHAENLVVISGDRHRAMISKHVDPTPYPIFEVTSSSLNLAFLKESKPEEKNRHRIGASFFAENFGMIQVDWENQMLSLEVRDQGGNTVRSQSVPISDLKLKHL